MNFIHGFFNFYSLFNTESFGKTCAALTAGAVVFYGYIIFLIVLMDV